MLSASDESQEAGASLPAALALLAEAPIRIQPRGLIAARMHVMTATHAVRVIVRYLPNPGAALPGFWRYV